jgi:tetratricopeptide (TPR) repeat protein
VLKDALELDARIASSHHNLAIYCFARQNNYSEAIEEARTAVSLSLSNSLYLAGLGYLNGRGGNKAEALTILEELKKRNESRDAAVEIAQVYVGLGDNDNALAWLEKAYQRHSDTAVWLNHHPPFERLRADPKFVDLLRRMAFPE